MQVHENGNDGFTLLEAIIALAIFTIGIVALYAAQNATIGYNFSASRMTTAVNWSAQFLESFISMNYDDLNDLNGDGAAGLAVSTANASDYQAVSPDGRYAIFWNVAEDTPVRGIKAIRVIVTSPGVGMGRRVQLDYLKYRQI